VEWEERRGSSTGAASGARRLADDHSAKNRRDETSHADRSGVRSPGSTHRTTTHRSKGKVLAAAGAVALVVVGIGAVAAATLNKDDHTPQATPAQPSNSETSSAPDASPPAPPPPPADTQPRGSYSVRRTITDIEQTNPIFDTAGTEVGDTDSFSWRFRPDGCETICNGTIRSSSGAIYAYTWDGTNLALARDPEPGTTACSQGQRTTGSITNRHSYVISDAAVTGHAADGRPKKISATVVETVKNLPGTVVGECGKSLAATNIFTTEFVAKAS
jgi:hypothetical protein